MLGQHVKDGIELHRMTEGRWDKDKGRRVGRKPTGEIYWKLAVPCSFCGDIIDECLCYPSKRLMDVAKDRAMSNHYFCSTICWIKDMNMNLFEHWLEKYEDSRGHGAWEYPRLDDKEMSEKIWQMSEWYEEYYSDEDYTLSEDLGAYECPI